MYRPLGNIYTGYKFGLNVCSTIGCYRRLCMQRMLPQGSTTHSAGIWCVFCPDGYRRRPRCTSCGVLGRDHLSWEYGEPASKEAPGPSLWPCWLEGGCENLLCASCGAASDGCHNHQRGQQRRPWYTEWGLRLWCGTVAESAGIACFPCVPGQAAINPPQLDAPPVEIRAAIGVPLIDLTSPAADGTTQQLQEVESPDPWGTFHQDRLADGITTATAFTATATASTPATAPQVADHPPTLPPLVVHVSDDEMQQPEAERRNARLRDVWTQLPIKNPAGPPTFKPGPKFAPKGPQDSYTANPSGAEQVTQATGATPQAAPVTRPPPATAVNTHRYLQATAAALAGTTAGQRDQAKAEASRARQIAREIEEEIVGDRKRRLAIERESKGNSRPSVVPMLLRDFASYGKLLLRTPPAPLAMVCQTPYPPAYGSYLKTRHGGGTKMRAGGRTGLIGYRLSRRLFNNKKNCLRPSRSSGLEKSKKRKKKCWGQSTQPNL